MAGGSRGSQPARRRPGGDGCRALRPGRQAGRSGWLVFACRQAGDDPGCLRRSAAAIRALPADPAGGTIAIGAPRRSSGATRSWALEGQREARQADDAALVSLASKWGDDDLLAEASFHQGYYFSVTGDDHLALQCYETGLQAARRAGNRQQEANILSVAACSRGRLGESSAAIADGERALELARDAGDDTVLLRVLVNLSVLYTELGDISRAIRMPAGADPDQQRRGQPLRRSLRRRKFRLQLPHARASGRQASKPCSARSSWQLPSAGASNARIICSTSGWRTGAAARSVTH